MWINDPWELFSLDILPENNDTSGQWVNKLTRSLLIIIFFMWYYSYTTTQITQVLIIGILLIIIIYAMTNKKEMFSPAYNNMDNQITAISELSGQTRISDLSHIAEPKQDVSPVSAVSPDTTLPIRETWTPTFRGYMPLPESKPSYFTPEVGENKKMSRVKVMLAPRIMDPQFSVSETNFQVNENPVQNLGGMAFTERVQRNRQLPSTLPFIKEQELSSTRMFLQDVQPHQYSITNDRTPVNANIGISYTPQIPPLTKQRVQSLDGTDYPLYSRIDPELIRDNVSSERRAEQPVRGEWSEALPETNPLNETTVYDPRHTGYGDSARAYYDSELGNVRYYYTDVDSYRSPNFVIRNKVDHVDFIDPMGKISSMYPRTEALDDVTDQVNTDWMSKSTEFREDMMERLMRKNNAMNWQMRHAPISKGSRLSSFTSSY
jgi:hypothetical protein